MADVLGTTEMDRLFDALQNMAKKPSITEIKPSQLEQIEDQETRRKWKKDFEAVNYLYVYPLEKVLKYFSIKKGQLFYQLNYEDKSLIERMISLEKTLVHMGYTKEQVTRMVPRDKEENALLLSAQERGFSDDVPCYNEDRIKAAVSFLQSLENVEEQTRRNCA